MTIRILRSKVLVFLATFGLSAAEVPLHTSELLFPAEPWHNHASCLVESGRGDLLVCWFHGSGERKADDVRVEGARWEHRHQKWSERFVLADTQGYPDCNPCLLVDRFDHLWLFHTTILAHTWESALLKFHRCDRWERPGVPTWSREGIVHITPGKEFTTAVSNALPRFLAAAATNHWDGKTRREVDDYLAAMQQHITNELYLRLGWMPRAHPSRIGNRLLLPLYHDGFSFSLIAISDDDGETWRCSQPLIGGGNIQPSLTQRRDGTLVAWMRDNGPPPHRVMKSESTDRGETWSEVVDIALPNPGSGVEAVVLKNGHWLFIGNDTEEGRHSLVVWVSTDEGRTWPVSRHLQQVAAGQGSFSYPSLIQSRDGSLHATYSEAIGKGQSSIRHDHFNEAWVSAGDPQISHGG